MKLSFWLITWMRHIWCSGHSSAKAYGPTSHVGLIVGATVVVVVVVVVPVVLVVVVLVVVDCLVVFSS